MAFKKNKYTLFVLFEIFFYSVWLLSSPFWAHCHSEHGFQKILLDGNLFGLCTTLLDFRNTHLMGLSPPWKSRALKLFFIPQYLFVYQSYVCHLLTSTFHQHIMSPLQAHFGPTFTLFLISQAYILLSLLYYCILVDIMVI